MPVYDYPPYIEITRDHENSTKEINGINYMYIVLLSNFFNFSIEHLMELSAENASAFIVESKKLIADGTVPMFPIPMFPSVFNYPRSCDASIYFYDARFVAFVPVLMKTRIILPTSLVTSLLMGTLIVISIITIAHLLHFEKRYWNFADTIRLVLGQTIPCQPQKIIERLFFIFIALLSMTCFNDIFSELMNVKIITDSWSFDTLKEIANSNLSIYIEQYALEGDVFAPYDEFRQRITSRLVNFTSVYECILELRRNHNCICFDTEPHGEFLMNFYNKYDFTPVMKIANLKISFDRQAYVYEKASPYVRRFNHVLLRIIQSGVSENWPYPSIRKISEFSLEWH